MLIDINLLPKKEPKNVVLLVGITIVLTVAIALGVVFYMSMQKTETQIQILSQQLKQTQALEAVEQQKLENAQSTQEVEELQKAVEWAKQYPLKTVLLLRNMAKLLPERGFMMNFSYAEDGVVNVAVQFDTDEEAAYYLKQLSEATFVSDVQLKSVSALEQKSGESTATNEEDRHILPRYLAQYELHVNKAALKEEKEKQP
ncbi:fimbrial protein [Anoxybacteroides tepidamans]|uniref:fimbrial protein n=1 Tax=Anoxybacteroides tepidamans TaxID=265948 RepID=UPI000486DA2C|nr:fimbrial protein [Anoxybacillus tepidamans]